MMPSYALDSSSVSSREEERHSYRVRRDDDRLRRGQKAERRGVPIESPKLKF